MSLKNQQAMKQKTQKIETQNQKQSSENSQSYSSVKSDYSQDFIEDKQNKSESLILTESNIYSKKHKNSTIISQVDQKRKSKPSSICSIPENISKKSINQTNYSHENFIDESAVRKDEDAKNQISFDQEEIQISLQKQEQSENMQELQQTQNDDYQSINQNEGNQNSYVYRKEQIDKKDQNKDNLFESENFDKKNSIISKCYEKQVVRNEFQNQQVSMIPYKQKTQQEQELKLKQLNQQRIKIAKNMSSIRERRQIKKILVNNSDLNKNMQIIDAYKGSAKFPSNKKERFRSKYVDKESKERTQEDLVNQIIKINSKQSVKNFEKLSNQKLINHYHMHQLESQYSQSLQEIQNYQKQQQINQNPFPRIETFAVSDNERVTACSLKSKEVSLKKHFANLNPNYQYFNNKKLKNDFQNQPYSVKNMNEQAKNYLSLPSKNSVYRQAEVLQKILNVENDSNTSYEIKNDFQKQINNLMNQTLNKEQFVKQAEKIKTSGNVFYKHQASSISLLEQHPLTAGKQHNQKDSLTQISLHQPKLLKQHETKHSLDFQQNELNKRSQRKEKSILAQKLMKNLENLKEVNKNEIQIQHRNSIIQSQSNKKINKIERKSIQSSLKNNYFMKRNFSNINSQNIKNYFLEQMIKDQQQFPSLQSLNKQDLYKHLLQLKNELSQLQKDQYIQNVNENYKSYNKSIDFKQEPLKTQDSIGINQISPKSIKKIEMNSYQLIKRNGAFQQRVRKIKNEQFLTSVNNSIKRNDNKKIKSTAQDSLFQADSDLYESANVSVIEEISQIKQTGSQNINKDLINQKQFNLQNKNTNDTQNHKDQIIEEKLKLLEIDKQKLQKIEILEKRIEDLEKQLQSQNENLDSCMEYTIEPKQQNGETLKENLINLQKSTSVSSIHNDLQSSNIQIFESQQNLYQQKFQEQEQIILNLKNQLDKFTEIFNQKNLESEHKNIQAQLETQLQEQQQKLENFEKKIEIIDSIQIDLNQIKYFKQKERIYENQESNNKDEISKYVRQQNGQDSQLKHEYFENLDSSRLSLQNQSEQFNQSDIQLKRTYTQIDFNDQIKNPTQGNEVTQRKQSDSIDVNAQANYQNRDNHPNILQQIDLIPNESKYSQFESENMVNQSESNMKKMQKFVESTDQACQKGIEYLGRMLQLMRLKVDQIDQIVLKDKFKPNQSIRMHQLHQILMDLLPMSEQECLTFTRFLIEEQEEDQTSKKDQLISFDYNRQVNSLYIPTRLMTLFTSYPNIFSDLDEQIALQIANQFLTDQQIHDMYHNFQNNSKNMNVDFDQFQKEIKNINCCFIREQNVECLYVYLCRKGEQHKDNINNFSDFQLKQMVKGFQTEQFYNLFEKQIESIIEQNTYIQKNEKTEDQIQQNDKKKEEKNDQQQNVEDEEYYDEEDDNQNVSQNQDLSVQLIYQLQEIQFRNNNNIDKSKIEQNIQTTGKLLTEFSNKLKIDEKKCCRKIFKDIIYSKYDEQKAFDIRWIQAGENKKGEEKEVVSKQDFVQKIQNILIRKIDQQEENALESVFKNNNMKGFFLYDDIFMALSHLGFDESKMSAQSLNYELLDFRSIRIINRLIEFLNQKKVSLDTLIQGQTQKQEVVSKQSVKQIEIIMAQDLFNTLFKYKLKKINKQHLNLCSFLCIEKKYIEFLVVNKLKKCLVDFQNIAYFKSFGLKKQNLMEDIIKKQNQKEQEEEYEYEDEEDEEEYYDEEDEKK